MSQTISGAVTLGVTFGPGYTSPLTIASSGNVSNQNYSDAVSAPSSYVNPTLINQGTVTGGTYDGVSFGNGGYVNNSGRIQGYLGVVMSGTGTITNSGTILGSGAGVALYGGGTVTNTAGKIEGVDGVFITGTYGTVNNSGTITGSGGPGVFLQYGGYVNNSLLVQGFIGVAIDNNGDVVNSGTILGSVWSGVALYGGGTVTNNAGTIQGSEGVYITGNTGTVTNSGTIIGGGGPHGYGVDLIFGGSVDNTNLIKGHTGVYVYGPGTITNSATILGTGASGIGVDLKGGGNTLINPGTISSPGTSGVGVLVVDGTYGPSTLINSGTISGGSGTAVYFAGTGDLLVVDPGAVFVGNVYGGASDTIELGSASSEGTLLGLGSSFVNFGTVTVDVGAYWTLTGSFSGVLENAGTLASVPSPGLYLNGTVINTGSLAAPFYIQTNGYLTNQSLGIIAGSCDAGAVVADNATVVNAGTIDNTGNVGPGAGVYLQGASDQVTNNTGGLIEGLTGVGAIVGSDVTITNAGTLDGLGTAGYGILLQGSGTVDNTGLITAAGANGIGIDIKSGGSVDNYANGTISGGAVGISISGSAGTVTNDGTIVGTSGDGIDLTAGGTVGNTNWIEGYTGVLITGALGTVTNSGTIEGTGVNVGRGVYLRYGGGVYNNAGLIKGLGGIYIIGSAGTVTNAGTVEGNYAAVILGTGGSVDNTGLIAGGHRGVEIDSYTGAVTNSSTIIGTASYAIILKDGGSVGNSGLIEGYRGVYIGGTSGTVTNSGTIVGTQGYSGILLEYGGSVANNAGLIEGPDGVEVNQASGTVANSGTIIGTGSYGVYLKAGGSVSNDAGLIQGYDNGVYITGSAGGTVSNSGTILGMIKDGVYLQTYGSVGNTSTAGLLQGSGYGVRINGTAGTVTNGGTILGTSDYGVYLRAGSVTNNGGLIEGAGGVVIEGSATLTNFGTILGTIGYGVFLGGGGGVYNNAGLIEGWGGVKIVGAAGTVTNAGTIIGTASYGVDFAVGGSTLVNAGMIEGSGDAVHFAGGGNLVIVDPGAVFTGVVYGGTGSDTLELGSAASTGTLSGLGTEYLGFEAVTVDAGAQWALSGNNTIGTGVTLSDLGTLTNAGSLSGSGTFIVDPATLYNTGYIGMTVTLSGGGYLDNEAGGTITVAGDAVFGTLGAPTIVNAGTIIGNGVNHYGIDLRAGGNVGNNAGLIEGYEGVAIAGTLGTVTNTGTIEGTGNFGGGVDLRAGGSVDNAGLIEGYGNFIAHGGGTVTNSGTMLGTGSYGIYFAIGSGGSTLVNAGTIIGAGGTAVRFDGSGNLVIVDPGAVFTGVVYGGTGSDTLELGSAASTGTLSGLYTKYIGFETITVDTGAQWALSGNNTIGTGVSLDNLGTLTIAGTLTDLGTLTNTGTIGGSGTFIVDPATLYNSGSIGMSVTLSGGGYLDNEIGGTISAATGIAVYGTGGAPTIVNAGTISDGGNDGVATKHGISLTLTNQSGATIYGRNVGILARGSGAVTNSGTIISTATYGYGVILSGGGSVSNAGGTSPGLIEGYSGIYIGPAGTVTNSGTILATGGHHSTGIYLYAGGSVGNNGGLIAAGGDGVFIKGAAGTVTNSGTITGATGVDLLAGGTVTDSGTISGASTAISFGGTGGNLLALEHGYSLGGTITVAGIANTLELYGAAGAVTVDFDKSGAGFTNFGTAGFGAASGNDEIIKISNTTALPGTISGFTQFHDIVDLTQFNPVGAHATLGAGDMLIVSNGSQSVSLQLDNENYSGVVWQTSPDSGSGTDVEPACFCIGTRILTETGVVAVEELAIGDRVVTISGEAKPIRWIGRRGYDGRFVAGNRAVLPIRVMEGALGDGVPARDLWLSPEHALYIEGALVPAGLLVNGASILQAEEVDEVEYFHIELDRHDVIFADGAPAESFIDDDSRGVFHNAAEFYALYPDAPARVPPSYCAPRLEEGFELEALRRRLLGRARRLGAGGTAPPGVLRGCLELVGRTRIDGWAIDPVSPDTPVSLVILANGAEIGRVVANRYRRDLDEAGIGDGRHAFELVVPGGLAAGVRHEIEVRREADWHPLFGSPAVLEPVAVRFEREPPRSPAAASPPLGALRGSIDSCDGRLICGWAQDSADPERRVGLLVKLDDQVIGRVLANRFRADLEADGIGDGRHAFELPVPNGLSPLEAHEIRIEREADGAELPGSPWTLPAAHRFDAAIEQHLADIFAGAAAGAAEDRTLAFLTEQTDRLLARRAARDSGSAERNAHRLFRRRWGPPGANDSHSLGAPRLRALVVDSSVPCATRDAGSVAILSHVRAFRGLGYEVSFAASDEMGNEAALAMLAAAEGIATCGGPHYSCLEDVLCRQAGTFDVVYLHRIENADRYLPLARRYCPKARILYSVADLHHLRIARQAQVERRPELLARSRHLAAVEFLAARRADIVITHSPVEADLLRREAGFGKVHVVPFAVPPRPPRRPFAERHGLAILGSFEHAPNPDAVHHLVSDILPLVWAREPTLGCKIVGHGWHAGRLPHRDPRIEMIGAVADLDEVFDTVRLTVAPLRFGAGIKGKVVDSFAAGLPCVMTPIAAEGLALTGSLPQLVSEDPTELAELIVRFHADRRANDQVGLDGARLAAQQFSAERVIDLLREVLTTPSSNKVANDHRSSSTTKMTAIA